MLGPGAAILLRWTAETDLWKQDIRNTWFSIIHKLTSALFTISSRKKKELIYDLWAEGMNGHL